jgi:hypothetical protein
VVLVKRRSTGAVEEAMVDGRCIKLIEDEARI